MSRMDVEPLDNPLASAEKWLREYLERTQVRMKDNRITLSLDALRQSNSRAVQQIIHQPFHFHKLVRDWAKAAELHNAQSASEKTVLGPEAAKEDTYKQLVIRVSFEGNLGANFVSPRGLGSRMANQLVGVQGLVTRMSITRSMLNKSVHFCEKTNTEFIKQYPDEFAPEEIIDIKLNKAIPREDSQKNPYNFEYGKSTFKNFQTLVVQELPEMAPLGQLPRSVVVILEDDLINSVKPGDRVQLIGIFKLHVNGSSYTQGIFKPTILCTSITVLNQVVTPSYNKINLKLPFPEKDILSLFSHSVSPSVYGHEHLKKAVLLMLLGGRQKNLENGTHLRGDINLLMVGDPGVAKSQVLRWVLSAVNIGVPTTGSGASGVGLTAAITYDRETGERNLEAGAMVLADRGFVCIDEFDKMSEVDRVAVHEVMEQQTVTIAKAGVHCSLNARCSVIAAANPIYGDYLPDEPPTKNIGMADSLLSRFDLIFILRDERAPEKDKRIAERVCRNHKFSAIDNSNSAGGLEEDDYIIQPQEVLEKEELMFEKNNLYKSENKIEILTQGYLKQYISFCRKMIHPDLSNEAVDFLAKAWHILRTKDAAENNQTGKKGTYKVLPVTIRTYESLIRLSTAHAKLRLSNTITVTDCLEAFKLMVHCLYGDEHALDSDISIDTQGKMQTESIKASEPTVPTTRATEKTTKKPQKIKVDEEQASVNVALAEGSQGEKEKLISEIFNVVRNLQKNKKNAVYPTIKELKQQHLSNQYSEADVQAACKVLQNRGKLHISDGKLYI